MRLTRHGGNTGNMRSVEAAHQELTGSFKPYHRIAADLYSKHGTQRLVRREIERLYGVSISTRAASEWVNRGLEAIAAEQSASPTAA